MESRQPPLPQRRRRVNRPRGPPPAAMQTMLNPIGKNASRNRRRRAAKRALRNVSRMNVLGAQYLMPQAQGVDNSRLSQTQRRLAVTLPGNKVTPEGVAFLKCAFAPPDFNSSKVEGVPDEFEGRSLVKKHRIVESSFPIAANTDYYILLLPTPGIAFWYTSVAANTPILATTVFTGVNYTDFSSLFGINPGSPANTVNAFRYVSNHIEFIPTVNNNTWTGSISAWKLPIKMVDRIPPQTGTGATVNNLMSITGLSGCNSQQADQYTGPFNLGLYSGCYSSDSSFKFQQIVEGIVNIPFTFVTGTDFAGLLPSTSFTGLDNGFESLVVKIGGVGANANNSLILKTWSCVEYQVVPDTSVYEYSTVSPCDELALKLYRRIVNELPVGVSYLDNESFWERVLKAIQQISGSLAVLPGPYGLGATGINSLSTAIRQLVF